MTDIDDIKSRLNIVDIVGARVPLKKAGRNFKGLCPFHTEKTPSFIVSPDRQTFHCFGCGKGGSVFDFVMLLEHIDFAEALEMLADRAGVKLERRPTDTPEAKMKQKLYEVNHLASEYYQYLLTRHAVGAAAREYLAHRGISERSMKTFALGYSPNDWDGLLTFLTKKGYDATLLETAGLVIRGSRGYYDRFRGRVMFTLKDHRGNVVGFSGRVLDPNAKEAKYINTSETPVYVKGKVLYAMDVTHDAIQKENEAIVMEGELDVISSFQIGISNVVAIKGSAMTEDHARLLRRYCERLVFALDSDVAGDAAARRGIEIADTVGFDMRVLSLPSGKDPDEAARTHPGLLKKAVKEAVPLYDYLLSSAMSRYDKDSAYGKRKITDEYVPFLAAIENAIVRGHYIRKLSEQLGIPEEAIAERLANVKNRAWFVPKEGAENAQSARSRSEKGEVYLLALLLQGSMQDLPEQSAALLSMGLFGYPPVRSIVEKLVAFAKEHPVFLVKDFADTLPAELIPVFDEAFLWDIADIVSDGERFAREWDRAVREVKRTRIRHQMKTVSQALRDTDASSKEYDALQQQLKAYTDELVALEKSP